MSPFVWLTLRTQSLRGFMKFKILFVKSEYEEKLQLFGFVHITLMEKKKTKKTKLIFSFSIICPLKELNEINILKTVP